MPTRRAILGIGGGLLAGLSAARTSPAAAQVEIGMQGNAEGSHVWFDPIGIRVQPGQSVRWVNRDPGNSHTATAYHPRHEAHPLRIPAGAEPWDSDYLLPDEAFSVTLTVEGVYDYFCVPHEHAGMVGRIVVGDPARSPAAWLSGGTPVPEAAERAFPPVDVILRQGVVRRT